MSIIQDLQQALDPVLPPPQDLQWMSACGRCRRFRGQVARDVNSLDAKAYLRCYAPMHLGAQATALRSYVRRPPVAHLALGCGPGTDAWAASLAWGESEERIFVGYDYSPAMVSLAEQVAAGSTDPSVRRAFFTADPDEAARALVAAADGGSVLITASHLFLQSGAGGDSAVLADLIAAASRAGSRTELLRIDPDAPLRDTWPEVQQLLEDRGVTVSAGGSWECPYRPYVMDWREHWRFYEHPDPQPRPVLVWSYDLEAQDV